MATRFAGDFFGISLVDPGEEDQGSQLLKYYPELRSIKKEKAATPSEEGADKKEVGARLYGGAQAAPTYAGFKTFEQKGSQKAAPLFTGFKTFEQQKQTEAS